MVTPETCRAHYIWYLHFFIDKLLECSSVAYLLRTDPLTFKGRSSPSQNICFTWTEIRFPVPQFPVENCSVRILSLFFFCIFQIKILSFYKIRGLIFCHSPLPLKVELVSLYCMWLHPFRVSRYASGLGRRFLTKTSIKVILSASCVWFNIEIITSSMSFYWVYHVI